MFTSQIRCDKFVLWPPVSMPTATTKSRPLPMLERVARFAGRRADADAAFPRTADVRRRRLTERVDDGADRMAQRGFNDREAFFRREDDAFQDLALHYFVLRWQRQHAGLVSTLRTNSTCLAGGSVATSNFDPPLSSCRLMSTSMP
ncbi:MAG: hypothetical protein AB7Q81_25490 [Gammaproteobacteria bacterium]|uniref:hypothetical protein n=1 Tax=Bradyrhizobium sp. TaxID=376 RepID=UPI003D10A3C7